MPEFEQRQNPGPSSYVTRPARMDRWPPRPTHDDNPLLAQHQALGNQAMLRFAESCPLSLPSASICPTGGACHTCPATVQTKLTINEPGDRYEREADRVAGQVLRMPKPRLQRQLEPEKQEKEELLQAKPLAEQITPLVQRQVEPEEEEEEEEGEYILAKQADGHTPQVGPRMQNGIHSIRGGGQPLPKSVRNFFEPRFGCDFSQVRVHNGTAGHMLARKLGAKAFTTGSDVFFRDGVYEPHSEPGRTVLGHELVHVVQQQQGSTQPVISQAGEASERDAETAAQTAAKGCLVGRGTAAHQPFLQRTDDAESTETKVVELEAGRLEEDAEEYIKALDNFFDVLRDNYQDACGKFAKKMSIEDKRESRDLVGAVLKEGLRLAIDRLVAAAGKYVPGFGEAIAIGKAIYGEAERYQETEREVMLYEFIWKYGGMVAQAIDDKRNEINHPDFNDRLLKEAYGSQDALLYGFLLYEIARSLKSPRSPEIELSLYEAWMKEVQSVRYGGMFGVTKYWQGVLLLHYDVNREETTATLESAVLAGPYAKGVKAGLGERIGEEIDVGSLQFTRLVEAERDRMHRWVLRFPPGSPYPLYYDPDGYFAKLIKELPRRLPLKQIEAKEEVAAFL